jgi:hypothetical protein
MKVRTALASAAIVALAGCATPPERAEAPEDGVPDEVTTAASCERPTGTLPAGASLVGMSGDFTLTMVDGSEDGRSASGSLLLIEQAEGLERWDQVETPLYGTSDIDLEAVGAVEVGDLSSAEATSPGVLVMEDEGSGGPRIRLRFGSNANDREALAFDGGYTILTVTELTADGFAGGWRSAAGGPVNEGWFCVWRVGAGSNG